MLTGHTRVRLEVVDRRIQVEHDLVRVVRSSRRDSQT